jgi:hypothetical protein
LIEVTWLAWDQTASSPAFSFVKFMDLALVGNTTLRAAIRRNLVTFPSQIPPFMKRGETQERIVQLYFVRGWRMKMIGERYGLSKSAVRKLLSEWRIRAIAAGYIQDIHPDVLVALASVENNWQQETFPALAWDANFPDSDDSRFAWEMASACQPDRAIPATAQL